MRWGMLAAAAVLASCSLDRAFTCESDDECALRAGGQCEADGWCSYPSDDCDGGQVYGPYAPESVADACVVPAGGSTGDSTGSATTGAASESGQSGSTGDAPVPTCGDGVVDEGEACDDGNTEPGDGCHPLCVEPYQAAWTANYDETEREDRGFAVDVDADADAIYIAGLTQSSDASGDDLLVQRWELSSGTLVWSWSRDLASGTDRGEQVVVDAKGDIVAVGVETDGAGDEHAWIAKFGRGGEIDWELADATGSKAEGVALADDGRIVAVGRAGGFGGSLAWHRWYAPDGTPDGEPLLLGPDTERGDGGVDVITVPGGGVQVTGYRFTKEPSIWTARLSNDAEVLWEHFVPDSRGDLPRGVGQALSPLGGTAIVGTRNTDRFVQFYDDAGTPAAEPWQEGESGQDEVADIAFLDDGRYVLVGFVGFNLSDTGTADGWIRFNNPDGTMIEQFPVSGTGGGLDKLLAVENAPHSVVVTGYVKNENTDIDLWLRRYAI
jgi:cysteine-rich repeat protein